MEKIKLKILDAAGRTLLTAPAGERVSLVYCGAYAPGDRVALEIDTPGQYCFVQFEDTMAPALVYVEKREINFHIPLGEAAAAYSPKSFQGACHCVRARLAEGWELAQRRNLALNPYDQAGDTGFFPHVTATAETPGAAFAARNVIDGMFENGAHGFFPYQSWGTARNPDAALTLRFGRPVFVDELRLTQRCDFPHDNYWAGATVSFSDGSSVRLALSDSPLPQRFPISPRKAEWLTLEKLSQAEGVSPFPALTQLEAWGTDITQEAIV